MSVEMLPLENGGPPVELDGMVTEQFIRELTREMGRTEDILFSLLSARGFLLERDKEGMFLSDNSHHEDRKFLAHLLEEMQVGHMEGARVCLEDTRRAPDWKIIFSEYSGSEAFEWDVWSEWEYFRSRRHGIKLPVLELDPYIGRLVKALSAVGIITSSSCDGHGVRAANVFFCGAHNGIWFRVLLRYFIKKRMKLKYDWKFRNAYTVLYIRGPVDDVAGMYLEILKVADLIYDNRVALRDAKKSVLKGIGRNKIEEMKWVVPYSVLGNRFIGYSSSGRFPDEDG